MTAFRGRSSGETEASCASVLPSLPNGPRFQTEVIICSAMFIHFFCGGDGENASLFMLLSLLPQALSVSVGGRKVLMLTGLVWRKSRAAVSLMRVLISPVVGSSSVGRYTVCWPSGLHYFPSWGAG